MSRTKCITVTRITCPTCASLHLGSPCTPPKQALIQGEILARLCERKVCHQMTLRVFQNEILVLQKNQGRVMELFIVKSAHHQEQFLATKANQHTVENLNSAGSGDRSRNSRTSGYWGFHEYIVETMKGLFHESSLRSECRSTLSNEL